jgi:hypothetical protein
LLISLLSLSIPIAARPLGQDDNPNLDDKIGYLPPETEPTQTITVAMTSAIRTKMYMPTVSDNGVITAEVPLTVVVAAAVAPAVSFGAFDRRRLPVEIQSWWLPAYGHVHTGIMLPFADTVSGILTLPVRVVLHDNPGKLHLFSIAYEGTTHLVDVKMGDLTCKASVCAWGFDVKLDTRLLKDGCRELRVKNYINTPDGKQMITSSGIPVMVKNGGASSDFNNSCTTGQFIGRGWYTNILYINSIFESVPTAPVHGTITVGFRAQAGASSRMLVELDKSHFIPAVGSWPEALDTVGTVLFDQPGNFTKFQHITIDTTKLANGWHSLSAKSFSKATALTNGQPNQEVGVAKYWFFVEGN